MKFLDLVKSRQSCRKYSDKAVEREKILRCVEASRLAPSASNMQPWSFIIVDDPPMRDKVAGETFNAIVPFNKFALKAPVIAVIVIEGSFSIAQIGGRIKNKDYRWIDIGIAAEHFCLQAEEEGLGTCMLGWYNEKNIQKLLNIPKNKRIGLLITLGYSESAQREKTRKSINDILKFNNYE